MDASGAIYAAGTTSSSRLLPVTSNIPGLAQTGAFIMKLTANGSQQIFSTALGSGIVTGLALDGYGNAFVSGYQGGALLINGKIVPGIGDDFSGAFVAKINDQLAPLTLMSDQNPGTANHPVNLTARIGDLRYAGSVEFRNGAQSVGTVAVASGDGVDVIAAFPRHLPLECRVPWCRTLRQRHGAGSHPSRRPGSREPLADAPPPATF